MLGRVLGSRVLVASRLLVAGAVAAILTGAGPAQAASVLIAQGKDADSVNETLDALNAGGGSLISGVIDLGKFKAHKSDDFDGSEILYYTLKAGRDTQLFGFFDETGKQISLLPADLAGLVDTDGLGKASFFGRQSPIPEPTSLLLLLAGGALAAFAARKTRSSDRA